jgi:hypothetical protein
MSLFQYIYDTVKQFFVFLSCRTNPSYTNLTDDDSYTTDYDVKQKYKYFFEI